MQIKVARGSEEIMVNVVFILCVVVMLCLTSYGVAIELIFDRESIVLTALLTVVVRVCLVPSSLSRQPQL